MVLMLAYFVSSCAFFAAPDEEQKLTDLFQTAEIAMREERFNQARENFEKIEESHPFSIYAQYIHLALAYIYYENHQYPEADAKLDLYIRQNPTSENLDYAYFMKGLVLYNTAVDTINIIIRRDRTDKDPHFMIKSFETFRTLAIRFPNSRYTSIAQQYLVLLRNILALYEIRIADFYMRRGAYVAVINRAKYVLEHYPGTGYTPQALTLLVAGYQALGFTDLAQSSKEVLALNYPNYRPGTTGKLDNKERQSILQNMQDIGNTVLEQIQVKPRY